MSAGYQPASGPVRITYADPSASHEALLAPRHAQNVRDTPSLSQIHRRDWLAILTWGPDFRLTAWERGPSQTDLAACGPSRCP